MAIPVLTLQLHTERANSREYGDNDHRVDPAVCSHTRFWDLDAGQTFGQCLDCGGVIRLGEWTLVEDKPQLIDSELRSERHRFNLFWFGGFEVVAPQDAPPDLTGT